MLKLYYAPGTCALASHIALIDAGADFEAVRLDFTKQQQQSADYLAINPKGRVPALVTEQGVITETPAILAYVAQTFPAAKLAPVGDPFAFAHVQTFNSYLCSTCHVAHAHLRRGTRWVVFEPNDMTLWKAIKRDISAFLTLQWRQGALMGATPEEAFFVQCDAETNPPDVIDAGQVVAVIGIAPVKPAEFVIFRIGQSAAGTQVEA